MVSFSKVVKAWGKTIVIVLGKDDKKILNVEPGDIITFQVTNVDKVKDKGDVKEDGI